AEFGFVFERLRGFSQLARGDLQHAFAGGRFQHVAEDQEAVALELRDLLWQEGGCGGGGGAHGDGCTIGKATVYADRLLLSVAVRRWFPRRAAWPAARSAVRQIETPRCGCGLFPWP